MYNKCSSLRELELKILTIWSSVIEILNIFFNSDLL